MGIRSIAAIPIPWMKESTNRTFALTHGFLADTETSVAVPQQRYRDVRANIRACLEWFPTRQNAAETMEPGRQILLISRTRTHAHGLGDLHLRYERYVITRGTSTVR